MGEPKMDANSIPDIVVSRLPRYLQALQQMDEEGKQATSSQELGERIGISAAQIRKDLSHFGEFGKQGTGYSIPYLIDQLQMIIKVKRVWEIALVGAGDLGHAIARYQGFTNRGFRIALVFDNDPKRIGTKIGDFIVQDAGQLIPVIRQSGIRVAMLTVPASVAQAVAEELVKAGVCAILSYAPIPLSLPPEIYVQYIDPIIQLQHMTYYIG
jgi:redox-sensing transcriptional repressor